MVCGLILVMDSKWLRRLRLAAALLSIISLIYFCSRPFTPPFRSDLLFGRGFWYMRQQQDEPAIENFSQAIELHPENAAAYLNRGQIYARHGVYDRALADYSAVIDLYPDNSDAYFYRGQVYFDMGNYDAALADYSTAIEIMPYFAELYYRRGLTYEELGEPAAALADYERFLERYGLDDSLTHDARTRIEQLSAE